MEARQICSRRPTRSSTSASRERVWSWLNTAVLDEAGRVRCIIHRAEDVTEREADRQRLTQALKLQRVAEKTARLGGFEVELGDGLITWSEEACAIIDLPAGHAGNPRAASPGAVGMPRVPGGHHTGSSRTRRYLP